MDGGAPTAHRIISHLKRAVLNYEPVVPLCLEDSPFVTAVSDEPLPVPCNQERSPGG